MAKIETTVSFTLSEHQAQKLNELMAGRVTELTLDQIIEFRNIVSEGLTYESDKYEDVEYNDILKAVKLCSDYEVFRPVDQRSFPEFAMDEILEWIDDNADEDTVIDDEFAYKVMEYHFTNGTMTMSTAKAQNYIRSFWDDFIDEDIELMDSKTIFERPELFLVEQTYHMIRRIVGKILKKAKVSLMTPDAFVKYVKDEDLRDHRLSDLVYK